MKIVIDKEFAAIFPPLIDSELEMLERDILKRGCRDPICLWNGVIVDGHNRYAICQKHGIKFKTVEIEFGNREEAKEWIVSNQLGRRNLSFVQASYMRGCYYRNARDANDRKGGYTQVQVAELFSVSNPTIRRDRELADAVDTMPVSVREYILRSKIVATHSQVLGLSKLQPESQKLIISKVNNQELPSIRSAMVKLRGASSVRGDVRRKSRCRKCGDALPEGTYICPRCDLAPAKVKKILANGLNDKDNRTIADRHQAFLREVRIVEASIETAARTIIEFLADHDVVKNSSCHRCLAMLYAKLMDKVGTRRENEKQLRVIIDAEYGDKDAFNALTGREKQVFQAVREFTMENGRPPKLEELAKRVGMKSRSEVNQWIGRLREKGVLVRD